MTELTVDQYFSLLDKQDLPVNHGYERLTPLHELDMKKHSARDFSITKEIKKKHDKMAEFILSNYKNKILPSDKLKDLCHLFDVENNVNASRSINIRLRQNGYKMTFARGIGWNVQKAKDNSIKGKMK